MNEAPLTGLWLGFAGWPAECRELLVGAAEGPDSAGWYADFAYDWNAARTPCLIAPQVDGSRPLSDRRYFPSADQV
jgi:hypothetical protein